MVHIRYASCLPLLCLISAIAVGGAALAASQAKTMEGKIRKFECGDNCYLTIVDKSNKEHTGLCTAPECAKWNDAVSIPPRFKGQRVLVTLGRGVQRDGDGNVMGRMTAFERIRFAK